MESITHLKTFMKITKLAHFPDQLIHQFLKFIKMNLNVNPFLIKIYLGCSIFIHLKYHAHQYGSFSVSDLRLNLLKEGSIVCHVEYAVHSSLSCQYIFNCIKYLVLTCEYFKYDYDLILVFK